MDEDIQSVMEPVFIPWHGGTALLFMKYKYHQHKLYTDESSIWRCSTYKKTKCSGSLTISKDKKVLFEKIKPHICEPDPHKNDVLREMNDLRNKVVASADPVPLLYSKKMKSLKDKGLHFIMNLPTYDGAKHFLYNARNKAAVVSRTTFKDINEVELPLQFRNFLLADYADENTRILVFSSEESRHLISTIDEYFGDGTFASCPDPFAQLYIIHGDMNSTREETNVRPLIYALMSNRTQKSYFILFSLIKSQLPRWRPRKFHCDYETGMMNAVLMCFPKILLRGCYYHWTNAIRKKAKSLKCINSKPRNRIVGLTAALPLIPTEHILEGFEYIKSECLSNDANLTKFIKYVENYWLKVHSPCVFSVFSERHRTTNVAENFHFRLNKHIKKNTTMQRLLNVLTDIHDLKIPAKRKRNSINNDDFILQVQMQLINNKITVGHALDKLRF